jgi:hypothetical protein
VKKAFRWYRLVVGVLLMGGMLSSSVTVWANEDRIDSVGDGRQLAASERVPAGLSSGDWRSIRTAYEAGRHDFQATATGWRARNPGQQWVTTLDRRGFLVHPQGSEWQWGLELTSYGYGDAQQVIAGPPQVRAEGIRLS